MEESKTKLETVEHQLETAKAEVQKPFAQEAELAEKLDRLSALNALLNMDEKGNDALGMDDEPEQNSRAEVADKPSSKGSLKEKLEVYKVKAAGVQNVGSPKKMAKEEVI